MMTAAEVIEKMKSDWMLVVNREAQTATNGDVTCAGISELTLSKDGETDIKLPPHIFDEISPRLSEPEHEHLCIFIYSLAQ